jgi:hypothetical protein
VTGRPLPRMRPAERAHIARTWRREFAAQPAPPPPPVPLGVAEYARAAWMQQADSRGRLRRWLHDTFSAELPGGES